MIRRLVYRALLALHPSGFRTVFADEMLCVFDEAHQGGETGGFCASAALSLVRHWSRYPLLWTMLGAAAGGLLTLFSGFSIEAHLLVRPLNRFPVSTEGLVLVTASALVAVSATTVFAVRVFLSLRRRI